LGAYRLRPDRIKAFKLSNQHLFADELRDIVGLYVGRPADAVSLFAPSPACRRRRGAWATTQDNPT
jgi:hypothetical protein